MATSGGLPIATPAPPDQNGLESEIGGGETRTGGDARLA